MLNFMIDLEGSELDFSVGTEHIGINRQAR